MPTNDVVPFQIQVTQDVLDDLHERLVRTRWPVGKNFGWESGVDTGYLKDLVTYWSTQYDWRAQEAKLNQFPQYTTVIDGVTVHFLHVQGEGSSPTPLLLTHGYPDSVFRFYKLIPLLTRPSLHGGSSSEAFSVVIPSIPGYGFSEHPGEVGTLFKVNDLWAKLMSRLGYERYGAHGGDWGSTITEHLARSHSDHLLGIHLTDVPFAHLFEKPKDLTQAEEKYIKASEAYQQKEGAYALIQGTKPQSLAQSLNDSPSGLAAWIIDRFYAWSDCDGKIENRFSKDDLITNVMLYWISGSIGTSFLAYYDYMHAGALTWMKEAMKKWVGSTKVPTAFALFSDIGKHRPPREWAERFFNVRRWTELPKGGHFAALEEPKLLAQDLRAWFGELKAGRTQALKSSSK